MLVDNLIDNAGKAGATKVVIRAFQTDKIIVLEFADNGAGLTDRFSPEELFEKGVTNTSGSGIGLNHVKQIVDELQGKISISSGINGVGAIVRMEFKA